MTELEERLAQPGGEILSQEMQTQLATIEQRLRIQLSKSVPRCEFEDWQASADAVAAATEVLQVWQNSHRRLR